MPVAVASREDLAARARAVRGVRPKSCKCDVCTGHVFLSVRIYKTSFSVIVRNKKGHMLAAKRGPLPGHAGKRTDGRRQISPRDRQRLRRFMKIHAGGKP